jgi:hypothetical protein
MANWNAPPLTRVVDAPVLFDETIENAVIIIRPGYTVDSCTLRNVFFVCETDAVRALLIAFTGVDDDRVSVGGTAEALRILALASVGSD